MAGEQFDPRPERQDVDARTDAAGEAERPLGELFRRLTADTSELVRQEVALARAEIREAGAALARDGAKIGIALGLALTGVLALAAFLIVALGNRLGNYWLAALIVGVVLLAIGALLTKNAVDDIRRRRLAPNETVGTLREDAAWAKQEARDVKRELTR